MGTDISAQIKKALDEAAELEKSRDAANARKASIEKEIADLNERITNLGSGKDSVAKELDALLARKGPLSEEISKAKAEIDSLTRQKMDQETKAEALRAEAKTAAENLDIMTQINGEMVAETEKARSEAAKLLETKTKIEEEIARLKKEIEDLKEAIIVKGKAEGDRIVTQALNARDEIRAEIEEQMHDRVVEFSHKIFQGVLSVAEQKLVHEGLLEGVFLELERIENDRLGAVNIGGATERAITVKTAHPMTAEQKKKLEAILSLKLNKTVDVKETVENEIIAGVVIVLGSFVIDGSLSARFKKEAARIK